MGRPIHTPVPVPSSAFATTASASAATAAPAQSRRPSASPLAGATPAALTAAVAPAAARLRGRRFAGRGGILVHDGPNHVYRIPDPASSAQHPPQPQHPPVPVSHHRVSGSPPYAHPTRLRTTRAGAGPRSSRGRAAIRSRRFRSQGQAQAQGPGQSQEEHPLSINNHPIRYAVTERDRERGASALRSFGERRTRVNDLMRRLTRELTHQRAQASRIDNILNRVNIHATDNNSNDNHSNDNNNNEHSAANSQPAAVPVRARVRSNGSGNINAEHNEVQDIVDMDNVTLTYYPVASGEGGGDNSTANNNNITNAPGSNNNNNNNNNNDSNNESSSNYSTPEEDANDIHAVARRHLRDIAVGESLAFHSPTHASSSASAVPSSSSPSPSPPDNNSTSNADLISASQHRIASFMLERIIRRMNHSRHMPTEPLPIPNITMNLRLDQPLASSSNANPSNDNSISEALDSLLSNLRTDPISHTRANPESSIRAIALGQLMLETEVQRESLVRRRRQIFGVVNAVMAQLRVGSSARGTQGLTRRHLEARRESLLIRLEHTQIMVRHNDELQRQLLPRLLEALQSDTSTQDEGGDQVQDQSQVHQPEPNSISQSQSRSQALPQAAAPSASALAGGSSSIRLQIRLPSPPDTNRNANNDGSSPSHVRVQTRSHLLRPSIARQPPALDSNGNELPATNSRINPVLGDPEPTEPPSSSNTNSGAAVTADRRSLPLHLSENEGGGNPGNLDNATATGNGNINGETGSDSQNYVSVSELHGHLRELARSLARANSSAVSSMVNRLLPTEESFYSNLQDPMEDPDLQPYSAGNDHENDNDNYNLDPIIPPFVDADVDMGSDDAQANTNNNNGSSGNRNSNGDGNVTVGDGSGSGDNNVESMLRDMPDLSDDLFANDHFVRFLSSRRRRRSGSGSWSGVAGTSTSTGTGGGIFGVEDPTVQMEQAMARNVQANMGTIGEQMERLTRLQQTFQQIRANAATSTSSALMRAMQANATRSRAAARDLMFANSTYLQLMLRVQHQQEEQLRQREQEREVLRRQSQSGALPRRQEGQERQEQEEQGEQHSAVARTAPSSTRT